MIRRALLFLLFLVFLASPAFAEDAADPVPAPPSGQSCAEAHERAQVERLEGKLVEAQGSLRACANQTCPGFVRDDCVRWLDEVRRETPTVIFVAQGDEGNLREVRVTERGVALVETLDGRPVSLDPGAHEFVFEAANEEPKTVKVLLVQGEKNTVVSADYRSPDLALKPTDPASNAPAEETPETRRPVPTATYVAGGIALLATGSFVGFAIDTNSKNSAAETDCAPTCSDEVVSDIKTSALIADVSLGVAVGAAATAVVFYVLRPTIVVPPSVARFRATPSFTAGPGFAMATIGGVFP